GAVGGEGGGVVGVGGVAGGAECVRPAEIHAVQGVELLAHDKPSAPSRTFVLECQIRRDIAMHVFNDATNRGLGREGVQDTALRGPLVRNILKALLLCDIAVNSTRCRGKRRAVLRRKGDRNAIRARKVTLAVDSLVPFGGAGHVERAVCVTEIGAHHIVPRPIATRDKRVSAGGWIVAAGAIGFTRREIGGAIVAVLAR